MSKIDQTVLKELRSLDLQDSIECIERGIEIADELLKVLDADMGVSRSSIETFGAQADALRAWSRSAKALTNVRSDDQNDERDDESGD